MAGIRGRGYRSMASSFSRHDYLFLILICLSVALIRDGDKTVPSAVSTESVILSLHFGRRLNEWGIEIFT
jgi:hypothetical protein